MSTLRAVIERDGTICARCGLIVDTALDGNAPQGPNLGHRIPASQGGTDDLANLQLEHRRCNRAAGDRLDPPRAAIARPIPRE